VAGSLEGLKVLDLSRFIAGPLCGMLLGDMGADVIKVERPGKGEDARVIAPKLGGESLYVMMYNRNKRSLSLDFRNPEAQDLLRRLAAKADVLIENFRPGTMEQMGCGWDVLSEVNPRLVMVRISGFGQDGPLAQRPCFDVIAQAMSGLMEITGQPDGPPTMAGTFVIDYLTALYGAIGTLTAINARHATGRGQLVEATLLESALSTLMTAIPEQILLGESMSRVGNRDRYTAPVNSFRAADGGWVHIAAGTDPLFARLVAAIERPDLLDNPLFNTADARVKHAGAIEAELALWVSHHTAEEVVAKMDEATIPCAKVATMAEVVQNPQARHRNQIVEIDHPVAGRFPTHGVTVRLSETPGAIRRPAPLMGEHTREVLAEWLDLNAAEYDDLVARRVVQ
jgi:crotonobetainyl-CoA:carnitine CoA-transferase CaiB-like acyl-CoA transferase